VMHPDGTTTSSRRYQMSEANLRTAFTGLGGDVHVHLEAGELAAWVRSVIAPLVRRVVISHPRTNAWIANDPQKGDRIDACKLADLLRMNRVHEVYYAADQARRDFKQLVQHYDDLTSQQARLKCKIKARLRTHGLIRRGEQLFSESGREKVLAQLSSPHVRTAITQLYEVLDQTVQAQTAAHHLMMSATRAFPEVALLRTAPGVGPIGASRFVAYVQTPHRFSSKRKLWRYCRLGVSHRTSDGKPLRHPQLDAAGCGRLKDVTRKAFEVAVRARTDNSFKRAYTEALARTHNATHARLTVQRKIASTLRAMWLTQTPYQEMVG
jgi:transposase